MYQKTLTSAMMLKWYRKGLPGIWRPALCLILSRDPGDAKKVLNEMRRICCIDLNQLNRIRTTLLKNRNFN